VITTYLKQNQNHPSKPIFHLLTIKIALLVIQEIQDIPKLLT